MDLHGDDAPVAARGLQAGLRGAQTPHSTASGGQDGRVGEWVRVEEATRYTE